MVNSAFLEKFDAPKLPAIEKLPLDKQPGYDAGFAAGIAAEKEAQIALKAELIEKISEMSFVYAEARNDVLASLAPLFSELINKILPNLVDKIAHSSLAKTLEQAAESDLKTPLVVCVASSQATALENVLKEQTVSPIKVVEDASLLPGEVQISRGNQTTVLNSSSVIGEIENILKNLTVGLQEKAKHG